MHYTWIAGDINFLAWTCSGPRGLEGGRERAREREKRPACPRGWMTTRGGGRVDRGRGGRPAHERESTHPSTTCGGDFAPGECTPWFALFRGDFDEWTSDECPFLCHLQKSEIWPFFKSNLESFLFLRFLAYYWFFINQGWDNSEILRA